MNKIYIDVFSKDKCSVDKIDMDTLIAFQLKNMDIFNYSKEVIKAIVVLMRSSLIKRVKNSGYEVPENENIIFDNILDMPVDKTEALFNAEKETDGIIAVYGEKTVDMYFTKSCGGGTANSEDVLGRHISYLRKVLCRFCGEKTYEEEVELNKIGNYINYKDEINGIFSDIERDSTGRIVSLNYFNKRISGDEFVKLFKLKSSRVYFKENSVFIKVVGEGSGLGICLEGAEIMANSGRDYKDIINYYYTGIKFVELNEDLILNKLNGKKIVIDAGHGGNDSGNIRGNVSEKDANLCISLFLKEKLENKGAVVSMTREKDETVPLSDRIKKINIERPKLYISIHQNYFVSPMVNGAEVYCYDNDNETAKLSEKIGKEIEKNTKIKNRGVKRGDYFLLRETKVSGIIIECMYITGNDDINKFNNEYYEKIAEAIYKGICNYYNIEP